jgi:hypothetical protein
VNRRTLYRRNEARERHRSLESEHKREG